jgi:hypothetical protein
MLGWALLAVLLAASCRPPSVEEIAPAAPSPIPGARVERPSPKIHDLYPPNAYVGVSFAVRFDGLSVLGVAGEGFSPDSTVYFGDEALLTQFVGADSLAAAVPKTLIVRTGEVPISIRDGAGARSAAVPFKIVPPRPAGACPQILHIYPSSTVAGQGFSLRADGSSNLGVAGANFGPRSVISLAGKEVSTSYQGPGSLIAIVPREELERSRNIRVAVAEAGCPSSRSPEDLTVR